MSVWDLAVVGAGPAGMAAATTAAQHGLSVILLDEQQRPGGQIFRQPPVSWRATATAPTGYRWGRDLVQAVESSAVLTWEQGASVLGIHGDEAETSSWRVLVRSEGGARSLDARRVLIATGAMDLPVPMPGWTLPGVVTAGGIQTMAKAQALLMAEKPVLTGAHPLLLVVADLLVSKGADVLELVTPQRGLPLAELVRSFPAVPGHMSVLLQSAAALTRVIRAGVPLTRGAIVTEARGDGRVEEVTISDVDSDWRPTGAVRTVATDGLVIGYGFQPTTDLARQVGCRLLWDSPRGGWVVAHDDNQATSVPGVYVAGEPTGVAGAEQSYAEGRVAGLAVTADLNGGEPALRRELASARRDIRRANRFSAVVQRMFEPRRDALLELAKPDTLLCRCEAVTRENVEAVVDASAGLVSTVNAVKLECRTGMGPCQGRYCELSVAGTLARARGVEISEAGTFSGQFPARGVTVAELANLDNGE